MSWRGKFDISNDQAGNAATEDLFMKYRINHTAAPSQNPFLLYAIFKA